MNKKWQYIENDINKAKEISDKFNISLLTAQIIANKDLDDEKIKIFLEPTRNNFYDPFLLPDMEIAVDRIIKAIENKEKVVIFGDYDVDGITSTTVLKKFLEERGLIVGYHIPNRLKEGYGLNKEAIKQIVDDKATLMITVDCGISGIEDIEYANSLGIDTIVTDHHEPLEELPNAIAVIDPKIQNSKYPFNQLAGVGVVFKLIQGLSKKLGIEEKENLKYLDLVCLGTISDIVPLIDENRVIAKLGLKLIETQRNQGLKSLIISSGYKGINSNTISFGIAPRVNACGRMGFADDALKLFITDDINEIQELTNKLNKYNRERQETEKAIFDEALKEIEQNNELDNEIIVLSNEGWHHGVIGIVSSKITEMYLKPSILLCEENGICKGSGRSIQGLDLHEALCKTSHNLEKYGGHSMAVGLGLKKENLKDFKEEINNYIKTLDIQKAQLVLDIDMNVSLKDLTVNIVKELKKLEPFGEANRMPLFSIKNLKIDSIRALSEGKHLKLRLKDDNIEIDAIGFNLGYLADEYKLGEKVDIVGNLEINSYNGIDSVQMNLKDIR
ncbi:MAG: single-stranded-DNA-specific exonuclease RecJ [Clostridia bacterium]|nr:single-stranded-DNA-specific exonuclease RecJ [Clostridia bacterium]